MNPQNSKDNDWVWATHFLAIFFVVVCMGIVIYSVVAVDNIDIAKATMGFSSAILGVILGFYFNRERLTKESKGKDYFMLQTREFESACMKLTATLSNLHDKIEEEEDQ